MIVAERKSIPELVDILQGHTENTGAGLRHLRYRLSGRRRARGKHYRFGVAYCFQSTRDWTLKSMNLPLSASAITSSSSRLPKRLRKAMPCFPWAAAPASRRLPSAMLNKPVYAGLNTKFLGILEERGVWTEKCAACGACVLHEYGGICPVTRCAKHMLNGPCGGSREDRCEVRPDRPCAWQLIYQRLRTSDNSIDSNRLNHPRTGARVSMAAPVLLSVKTTGFS